LVLAGLVLLAVEQGQQMVLIVYFQLLLQLAAVVGVTCQLLV
jgi:hypothetical protein